MQFSISVRRLLFCSLFVVVIALSSCSGASTTIGSTTPGASTVTASSGGGTSPTVTTTAPPHAFAWFQRDSAHVPQIWASLNGAAPRQITHVAPDNAACVDQLAWSPPIFSPDLTHIVAALGSYQCSDGTMTGPLSIITVSSGAVAAVPSTTGPGSSFIRITQRAAGWINDSTIWYVNYAGLYTYSLGAASTTFVSLLGKTQPEEAALRGSTLFFSYQNPGFGSTPSNQYLRRFDLSTSSVLPGTINMGTIAHCQCSPGDFRTPGWDVSADGSHVAYQVVSPGPGTPEGVSASRFYYANADGSGASRIASNVATNRLARLLIAPNGALIAISAALPSPSVITASVTSPGGAGDPNLHTYHPDAYDFPVWKWDSSTFWVATEATSDTGTGSSNIYAFTVSSSTSTLGVSGAYNPWYTIGG
jgi:hypothetical protein